MSFAEMVAKRLKEHASIFYTLVITCLLLRVKEIFIFVIMATSF